MNDTIYQGAGPVTLVGGGAVTPAQLARALAIAPELVAADGGAAHALAAGHMPRAVVGDLDSLPQDVARQIPADRLHRIAEQDSTDFDKALRSIAAPLVIAVGMLGARLDHELAALNVLARRPDRACLLLGAEDCALHLPPAFDLDLAAGTRVSLFPMAPVRGTSEGLRWPIAGIDFAPGDVIGTSNEATGPLRLRMEGPGMLAILPEAQLEGAARALSRQPGWSPAP